VTDAFDTPAVPRDIQSAFDGSTVLAVGGLQALDRDVGLGSDLLASDHDVARLHATSKIGIKPAAGTKTRTGGASG
jgi:hypothetical protein